MTTLVKKKKAGSKKAGKKATTKKAPAKASSNAETPAKRDGNQYLVSLMPRHAQWVEAIAAAFNRTPEHQIEKFVREAFAQDPNRAKGHTATKDNLAELLELKKPS